MLIQYIAGALTNSVAAEHVTRREIIIGACCYIWNNSCGPIMMTSSNENIFRVTGHLCGEFTGDRWIPRTKASDAELWCFLWFAPEQTFKLNSKQWRGIPRTKTSDAELWCFLWSALNSWVNNREAGDLRRYRAHYDVTIMY